jgi:Pvc16 N-terminal domain
LLKQHRQTRQRRIRVVTELSWGRLNHASWLLSDVYGGARLIQFIDEAVEAHLRREVPLPETSVDISFAAPDRAWGAAVTRPTVNIFLWDIRRNTTRTTAGMAQQGADGQVERRPTNPVIDLRYVVTAWAAEHRDEHQLLGSVLTCILAHSSVAPDILPPQLPTSSSLSLGLASEEARVTGEFWSSLDGRLKPGLQLVVSIPLDIFGWVPAGPPTASVGVAAQRMKQPPDFGKGRPTSVYEPALRRRRSSGALTMEGRSSNQHESSDQQDTQSSGAEDGAEGA